MRICRTTSASTNPWTRLDSISEESIMESLNKVLFDPAYKENAVRISDSFKACGGAQEAGTFLEAIIDQTKKESAV